MTDGAGTRFLAELPPSCRPDEHAARILAPKVEALLSGDWTWDSLRDRLTAGIESVHNPRQVIASRIEQLAEQRPKGTPPPERPVWCGECDEHTRQRENAERDPVRCPHCHPRSVAAPPAAS